MVRLMIRRVLDYTDADFVPCRLKNNKTNFEIQLGCYILTFIYLVINEWYNLDRYGL